MLLVGILAVLAGLAILIWPILLPIIVAIALIVGGIWLVYVATTGRRTFGA
jgi:uncharacterized membrane protein HdeD (DUF308 family)